MGASKTIEESFEEDERVGEGGAGVGKEVGVR